MRNVHLPKPQHQTVSFTEQHETSDKYLGLISPIMGGWLNGLLGILAVSRFKRFREFPQYEE